MTDQEKSLQQLDRLLNEMISTPMGRRTFLASVSFLMAACASGEKHRHREGDNQGQETSLTIEDEKRMTQEVLPQMKKDYPTAANPELQNYISGLGRKLTLASQLEGNPYSYQFSVVDVGYVNAFALPAGTVMVTAPLIAMAETEAELAGVVGHEIGHVRARHTAERMDQAKKEQDKSWKYAVGGGLLGAAAGYGLGRLLCPPKDDKCLQQAAMTGAGAGAAGGLLVQKYKFMANSREDEMEADRVGFRVATAAGYDKDKVGLFYEKLLQMEKANKKAADPLTSAFADALSTHPPSEERVTQMRQMSSSQAAGTKTLVSSKDFERMKKICQEMAKRKQG